MNHLATDTRSLTPQFAPSGSELSVFLPNKMVNHTGILCWTGHQPTVLHRSKLHKRAVHTTLAEFSRGRRVRVSRRPRGDVHGRQIVARAKAMEGTPWRLLTTNCEHFTSAAFGDRAASKQLQLAGTVALVCLAILVVKQVA